MTATDELRRLLDERGVEWSDGGYAETATVWEADGILWHGLWRDGAIELVATMTPEQAVEATLGRGTCRMGDGGYGHPFVCSECGAAFDCDADVNYCPNCGRKVVDE